MTFEPTQDMINFLDEWEEKKQFTFIDKAKLLRLEFPGLSREQAEQAVEAWEDE